MKLACYASFVSLNPRSLSDFVTAKMDENAMAAAARRGHCRLAIADCGIRSSEIRNP